MFFVDYQHGNGHADMLVYEADDSVAAMPRSSNICQPLPGELPPMLLPHMPSNMDNRRPNYNVVHSGQNDMQPESTFKTDREVLMAMGAERSFGDARLVHTAPYWNGSEPQSSAANALQELAEPMISLMKVEQQMWEQQRFELALRNHHPPAYWCSIAYFELDQQVVSIVSESRSASSKGFSCEPIRSDLLYDSTESESRINERHSIRPIG